MQGPVIWNEADSPYDLPTDLYCVTEVHCRMILQDKTLLTELARENYDLAIVDLIANECSVALARALGLPVASYWGFGYQGGEVIHTSNLNLPALHGGVIGALLEITAVTQLLFDTSCERLPKTIDLSVDYLRSGRPQPTYGRAIVTRHGRRVANVRSEIWQLQRAVVFGSVYAHASNPAARHATMSHWQRLQDRNVLKILTPQRCDVLKRRGGSR